jgi:hypothetical protein
MPAENVQLLLAVLPLFGPGTSDPIASSYLHQASTPMKVFHVLFRFETHSLKMRLDQSSNSAYISSAECNEYLLRILDLLESLVSERILDGKPVRLPS